MLDTSSLTASEAETAAITELREWLQINANLSLDARFLALIEHRPLIAKMDRYLSRDDNALIVDLMAEFSTTMGLEDGHMMSSSILLADKLFLEPMFEKIGLATYPVNFATAILDLDEAQNRVSGRAAIHSIGRAAQTLMVLVRGAATGKMGIVALQMNDLDLNNSDSGASLIEFSVEARPRHFRKINEGGVEKATKEVCVSNFGLALGVLKAARLATEAHSKKHILFGKPLGQHQATQRRLSQGVVNEELLRCLSIRQHSEYSALRSQQPEIIRKIRGLIQETLTDMAHLHGAESVLGRTALPFLDLKLLTLGLIDDAIT